MNTSWINFLRFARPESPLFTEGRRRAKSVKSVSTARKSILRKVVFREKESF
jgi:hypothetical protein